MSRQAIKESIRAHDQAEAFDDATAAADRAARPRVLLVAPSLDILGGQAVQASRLLARLSQEGDVEVGFLPHNPRLPGVLRKLQAIKYVRTVVTSLLYVSLLLARVRKYDVIHIFSAAYLSFMIAPAPAILIAKLYRKKVVLNYRSGEAADHLRRWKTAVAVMRLADEIAVPSGYLVDVFSQFNLKATSVFNFVDTSRFRFRSRERLRPVFLSNRNLEPMYNVACVLRAFRIIQDGFPQARLVVAGDGSQRAELECLARELDLRGVEFVGRVGPERMHELYDAADIYLNSSNIDNMPGSIIEAFASGLPVVTTDAGGIPYIVTDGKTGLMVRCDDHEALGRGAITLLEDPLMASGIIAQAFEDCRKYQWSAVKQEWLDLYTDLLSGRKLTAAGENEQTGGEKNKKRRVARNRAARIGER